MTHQKSSAVEQQIDHADLDPRLGRRLTTQAQIAIGTRIGQAIADTVTPFLQAQIKAYGVRREVTTHGE